jgi:nitroreductase
MTVHEALIQRRSTPFFDSSVTIEQSEIEALLELASLSPSSMNLQPWETILCHSAEDKARLQAVSFNQKKISEASAVLIVLGNLHHHEHAPFVAESSAQLGYYPPERKQNFIDNAAKAYADKPQAQRDEAFRGSSLYAMALMLAAKQSGWDTAPMGGFEPDKLAAEFGLPDSHIPIMLLCIGKADPNRAILPRQGRLPVQELLHIGHFRNGSSEG